MNNVREMFSTHKKARQQSREIAAFVESAIACENICMMCADACLSEEKLDMLRHCIRTDLDCANICEATRKVLQRQTEPDFSYMKLQLQACEAACSACGSECERHAKNHEHCRICAEACHHCARACRDLMNSAALAAA